MEQKESVLNDIDFTKDSPKAQQLLISLIYSKHVGYFNKNLVWKLLSLLYCALWFYVAKYILTNVYNRINSIKTDRSAYLTLFPILENGMLNIIVKFDLIKVYFQKSTWREYLLWTFWKYQNRKRSIHNLLSSQFRENYIQWAYTYMLGFLY